MFAHPWRLFRSFWSILEIFKETLWKFKPILPIWESFKAIIWTSWAQRSSFLGSKPFVGFWQCDYYSFLTQFRDFFHLSPIWNMLQQQQTTNLTTGCSNFILNIRHKQKIIKPSIVTCNHERNTLLPSCNLWYFCNLIAKVTFL